MIYGKITLTLNTPAPAGHQIRLKIEDTSRADAEAVEIHREYVDLPAGLVGEVSLPFNFELPANSAAASLRGHLPFHEGEDIRSGDFISTEWISAEKGREILIRLQQI